MILAPFIFAGCVCLFVGFFIGLCFLIGIPRKP
jgi:hypothetical protein